MTTDAANTLALWIVGVGVGFSLLILLAAIIINLVG